MVAAVVPSYGLLLALNPDVIVTPNAVMFAVNPLGWVSV